MAFVIDIRRQAVMQHLMFKAMFELSKDRADFISLLFAKPRPAGLDATTPIQKMWEAFFAVPTDPALAAKTSRPRRRAPDEDAQVHVHRRGARAARRGAGRVRAVRPGHHDARRDGGGGGGNNVTFADLTGWSIDATGTAAELPVDRRALSDREVAARQEPDRAGERRLRRPEGAARDRRVPHASTARP